MSDPSLLISIGIGTLIGLCIVYAIILINKWILRTKYNEIQEKHLDDSPKYSVMTPFKGNRVDDIELMVGDVVTISMVSLLMNKTLITIIDRHLQMGCVME